MSRLSQPARTPRVARLTLALAAASAIPAVPGCRSPESRPFDPAALQAQEANAASETAFRRLEPVRPSPADDRGYLDVRRLVDDAQRRGTEADTGEIDLDALPAEVRMPLREAVRRAVLNNFEVAVAAYDPAIAETRIVEAEAQFDPAFRQEFEFEYSDRQIANTNFADALAGGTGVAFISDLTRTYRSTTALTQQLTGGGQASIEYAPQYLDSPTAGPIRGQIADSQFESGITLRFSQPLLRDFGRNVNRARIVINRLGQQISVLDFRDRLEEVALQAEQTYWQLGQARREAQIQRDLLDRTIATADRIRDRLGIDAEEGQVAQALTDVSNRRALLLQAEAQALQLSDQLKFLMNDPDLPVAGGTEVVTTTMPVLVPLLFDLDDAVETALLFRPEIAQQLLRVRDADTRLKVGRNNLLPRLNLDLVGGFQGLGESYGDAVSEQFGFDNFVAGVAVALEIPLGNREARAILRRAILQREQAVVQYAGLIRQTTLEVKQGQRSVSTAYAVLRQRVEAKEAAERAVEVVEAQEAGGGIAFTPQFSDLKLSLLASLGNARSQEAQAVAEYNTAIAEYERAKGTLMRYNNITIEESARLTDPPVGRPLYEN